VPINFVGHFEVGLEKGRIALPAPIKDALPGETEYLWVFCSTMFDCLSLATDDGWNEFVEPYRNVRPDNRVGMLMQQRLGNARKVKVDKQKRIVVPQPLLDWAGISDRCWVHGCVGRMELWAPDRWEAHEKRSLSTASLAHAVGAAEQERESPK